MPAAAVALDAHSKILPLDKIPIAVMEQIKSKSVA
jgi:chemotaxis response regulator CheB